MGFLKRLFGGSDVRHEGGSFIPSNDSDNEVLGCVLAYIHMAHLAEVQRGGTIRNDKSLGPKVTAEFHALQDFRKSRGYSYKQLESALWCPTFAQALHLSADRTTFLSNINNAQFLSYVQSGRSERADTQADGVVSFLVTLAFEMLGIDAEKYLRK